MRGSSKSAARRKEAGPTIIIAVLLLYLFLPIVATFLFSVAKDWQSSILPTSYTLSWYGQIFSDPRFLFAVLRTLLVGVLTVSLGLAVMVPVIFVLAVYFPKWEKLLQISVLLPFAFPPVVAAIGLIKLYSGGPVPLTGTIWILIAVYFILIQPFIYQSVRSSLRTIHAKDLMEAAEVLGSGKMNAFLRIILPNIWSGTLVACLLSFSMVFGEFVMGRMLVGGEFETVQQYLYNAMKVSGPSASAVVVTYFLFIFLISGIVLKLGKRKPKGYLAHPKLGGEDQ